MTRKPTDLPTTAFADATHLTVFDTADTSIAPEGRMKRSLSSTLWTWILAQFNASAADVTFSDTNGTILLSALAQPTANKVLYADGSGTVISSADQAALRLFPVEVVLGGDAGAITTGVKMDVVVPMAGTIKKVTLLADQSGSIVVDIWKDSYANFPPVVGDSITASAKPTISSATTAQDATLTGWTTAVAAGDILRFNVDSATTITRATLVLEIEVS